MSRNVCRCLLPKLAIYWLLLVVKTNDTNAAISSGIVSCHTDDILFSGMNHAQRTRHTTHAQRILCSVAFSCVQQRLAGPTVVGVGGEPSCRVCTETFVILANPTPPRTHQSPIKSGARAFWRDLAVALPTHRHQPTTYHRYNGNSSPFMQNFGGRNFLCFVWEKV